MLRRIPIHPWALGLYPILQLAVHNITQIHVQQATRTVIIALALISLVYLALRVIRPIRRAAAFLLSLGLLLFFSYGHLYALLKHESLMGLGLGRHRFLVPTYALAVLIGIWAIRRLGEKHASVTGALNVAALALLFVPVIRLGSFLLQDAAANRSAEQLEQIQSPEVTFPPDDLPDIYYLILDGYTRSDALLRDLGYDNSDFVEAMEAMGFYVAECGRSNYEETMSSLLTSLNMSYLSDLRAEVEAKGSSEGELRALLRHSEVRRLLEEAGYQTVAFQTGYAWSELEDADFYLSLSEKPLLLQRVAPLERLLLETSAVKILLDYQYYLMLSGFGAAGFPHRGHVELQLYILEQLPSIPAIRQPTFTFAHILIPHPPYVFGPEGQILTDPGFYGGGHGGPINEEYLRYGYTGEIAYVNSRILEISKRILEASDPSPIIIIQGDHGLRGHNRLQILNMYHFPGEGASDLYPTITPVNSFRVLLNVYFDADLPLLPDHSFDTLDESIEVKEPEPCPISGDRQDSK